MGSGESRRQQQLFLLSYKLIQQQQQSLRYRVYGLKQVRDISDDGLFFINTYQRIHGFGPRRRFGPWAFLHIYLALAGRHSAPLAGSLACLEPSR